MNVKKLQSQILEGIESDPNWSATRETLEELRFVLAAEEMQEQKQRQWWYRWWCEQLVGRMGADLLQPEDYNEKPNAKLMARLNRAKKRGDEIDLMF